MSRIIILWVVISILFLSTNYGQDTTFSRVYSGNGYDYGFSIKEVNNNGFLLFGNTSSYYSGNTDIFIICTDINGVPSWDKKYGSNNLEWGTSVIKSSNNEFFICGYTNNTHYHDYDVFVYKIDSTGLLLEENKIGGTEWDFGHSIIETTNNELLIVGETNNSGNRDIFIIKTDINLDTIWTNTYGDQQNNNAQCICESYNNTYLIGGSSFSINNNTEDACIIRINDNGDSLWSAKYDFGGNEQINSIIQNNDSNIVISGSHIDTSTGKSSCLFALVHIDGEVTSQLISNSEQDKKFIQLIENDEKTYTILGVTKNIASANQNISLTKLNKAGYFIDGAIWGSTEYEMSSYFEQLQNKCYIMIGSTEGFGIDKSAILFIKTDSSFRTSEYDTTFIISSISKTLNKTPQISIYPNPNRGRFRVSLPHNLGDNYSIEIFDIIGNKIETEKTSKSNNKDIEIQLTNAKKGTIIIHIQTEENDYYRKIIIL